MSLPLSSASASRKNLTTAGEFLRHGGLIFFATLLVNVATFAFHFAYSRALGVQGYGALYSIINVASFATVIAGILAFVVTKLVADAIAADRSVGRVSRDAIVVSCLFGLAVTLATSALAVPIAHFLHVSGLAVIMLSVFAGSQMSLAAARGVAQGTQMFGALAISLTTEALVRTGLAIGFIHAVAPVDLAVGAYSVGSLISLAYTLGAIGARFGFSGVRRAYDLKQLLGIGGGIAASSIAIAILSTVDVVLVRHYFTNEQSGLYGAVALVGKTLFFAVSFLPMVLLPKASAAAARGTSKQLLVAAGAVVLSVSGGALVIFYIAPVGMLNLVAGHGYASAAVYLFPYGVGMAALGAANGFAAYRMGLNDFSYVRYAVTLCLLECVAIVAIHQYLGQVIAIVVIASLALLIAVLMGLRNATQQPPPRLQDVIVLQEELEVH